MEGVSGFGSLRKSLRSPIEIWYNPPQIIIPIMEEKMQKIIRGLFDPVLFFKGMLFLPMANNLQKQNTF